MSFIRPELAAQIYRWRSALTGLVLTLLGLWFLFKGSGALFILGLAALIFGMGLLWTGWMHGRINLKEGGAGVVELTERRLSYYSATGGIRFSLDDVSRIEIETTDDGPEHDDMFWRFELVDHSTHRIPSSAAEGALLIDMLAHFDGADYEAVIRASASATPAKFKIWQKPD